MKTNGENAVVAQLPGGVRIASLLVADQSPPRHVYRVISEDGAVLSEHATLLGLFDSVNTSD